MRIIGNGGHGRVIREISEPAEGDGVQFIAVGDNAARRKEAERCGGPYATLVHPGAWVSRSARLGEGTVVMAGAIVQAGAVIGRHCIVNTCASVDHDCVLGDYVHVAPGVHLCGGVKVGDGALIGVGSCAVPGAKVASWTVVRAGSVIVKEKI